MKLMTKELEKKLEKYPLGSQEGLMEEAEVKDLNTSLQTFLFVVQYIVINFR